MERRQIRELIGRFLHNDVPGELQTQFRRWMLQPGDGDEKEAALREEWTAVVESPAAADRSEELQRLRHTIRMREAQQRRSRIFRRIRYAAAAAAVLLFAVGEYYYVRSASAVPAEIRLLTARGSKGEFQLPDGTKVWLNASSRLTYPETFDRRERRVTLEGEAYFKVEHNTRRPFVVEFEGGEIRVLGTAFNVKAYRGDDIVAVTLDEGRVVLDGRSGSFELTPSEQLLYDRRSGEGRIVRVGDAMRYSIWKDDVISFRDTPLAEVLETLSRWYDVRFETDGQPDRPISYTFATDNTLLDNVLREMELISPVRFERTKTEIKVSFR